MPSIATMPPLRELIAEYNKRAKTFNITVLALSALIRKIVIASSHPEEKIEQSIIEFVKANLEFRYQTILADLVLEHGFLVSDDFSRRFQIELYKTSTELEAKEEVDETDLVEYEVGIEIAGQLESISTKGDIAVHIENIRQECSLRKKSVADLTSFLEINLDNKWHLDIVEL